MQRNTVAPVRRRRPVPRTIFVGLGALVLVLIASGCVLRATDMLDVFTPPPGGTTVIPASDPARSCSVGRIGLNINDALEVTGFPRYSPSRQAGLRVGDIVRRIDGVAPRSLSHAQQLSAGHPGSRVRVEVWRHTVGRTLTFWIHRECL